MEIKSAGFMIGVLVTLLSMCFSQPVIPNYYYSGFGTRTSAVLPGIGLGPYAADPRTTAALSGIGPGPYATDPRTAAALSGYGYGADAAALAAAAVAGYPYTNAYYYNPSTWTNMGYPAPFSNPYFDWASYLPTDATGWSSFVGALPGDIRTSWNTFYSLYGAGVPNAANLWGRFIGQLPANLLTTWNNWWGNNYARRWNTVSPAGRTTTFQRTKAYAVPWGVRTRTLTDILRKPNGDFDNLSSDPLRTFSKRTSLNNKRHYPWTQV